MLIGLIKWFDINKGFGVIGTPEGEDYFLHINGFIKIPEQILKGMPIVFTQKIDRKNRVSATKCRLVANLEDWKRCLRYLGKPDGVGIEVVVTGHGRRGNPYQRNETKPFSLIGLSFKYLLKGRSEEEIINMLLDYFKKDLEPRLFVSYCELIENKLPKYFQSDVLEKILNRIFSYFRENLNDEMLFYVWKEKKIEYISYDESNNIEISEQILRKNIQEIEKDDLPRILKFSYGQDFVSFYLNNKFNKIDTLNSDELKLLYQFIEFENEDKEHFLIKLPKKSLSLSQTKISKITMITLSNEAIRLMQLHCSRLREKERRQYAAVESLKLGRGGVRVVCEILKIDKKTVQLGRKELLYMSPDQLAPANKQRRVGGGRKKNG